MCSTTSNPYIAGNPVGGKEAFIGRKGAFQDVLRMLKSPGENGIVLYGQRRIGKTSVLQQLASLLPQKGPYAPVYFDLQDKAGKPLDQVLKDLADTVCYVLGIPEPETLLDDLKDNAEKNFREYFLPKGMSLLPEKILVLLFDEFDVIGSMGEKQAGKSLFPYIRNLMSRDGGRVKFIFVVGRRIEDLSSGFLSLFKTIRSRRISLLSPEDTEALVRLSEQNDSLKWSKDAVSKVKEVSGGHPFLTQQLCQVIWDNMYDEEPEESPTVNVKDVEQAVAEALKTAENSLAWLYDGLGHAERVVEAALAQAGPKAITQEELEQILQESGVRILIGELQDAPRVLADWDLIQPEEGGYRFRVEMLRRWIAQKKPLVDLLKRIYQIRQPHRD